MREREREFESCCIIHHRTGKPSILRQSEMQLVVVAVVYQWVVLFLVGSLSQGMDPTRPMDVGLSNLR